MCSSTTRADGAQGRSANGKPRWKATQNGNHRLSYYGLTITVFPNKTRSGWTVSVVENGEPPTYSNYATEADARAAAEATFVKLKSSGEFGPPPPPSLREIVEDAALWEGIPPELSYLYVELSASLERRGERADLYQLELEDGRPSALYWVPHTQGMLIDAQLGLHRLIVTRWWLDRAEPAR